MMSYVLEGIGTVQVQLGRPALALAPMEESLALKRATLGEEHSEVARARLNVGETLAIVGRYGDALQEQERGVRAMETALGPTHPFSGYAHLALGKTLLLAGHRQNAVTELERALSVFRHTEFDAQYTSEALFELAKALQRDARARGRALELAREAEARWSKVPGSKDLAAVRAWLATQARAGR
jgi:tetratricopeptide (TPR) repeat protein